MLEYVHKAKTLYQAGKINEIEYIGMIWDGIKFYANSEKVVERATLAFLQLYEKNNRLPIKGDEIINLAGFESYKNPNSHGLWPWLKKKGNADVIKQETLRSGEQVYSVNEPFYQPLCVICLCAKEKR